MKMKRRDNFFETREYQINIRSSYLSRDNPQAMTETFSGKPIGSNISGRNTPELPTSTHFFKPARI